MSLFFCSLFGFFGILLGRFFWKFERRFFEFSIPSKRNGTGRTVFLCGKLFAGGRHLSQLSTINSDRLWRKEIFVRSGGVKWLDHPRGWTGKFNQIQTDQPATLKPVKRSPFIFNQPSSISICFRGQVTIRNGGETQPGSCGNYDFNLCRDSLGQIDKSKQTWPNVFFQCRLRRKTRKNLVKYAFHCDWSKIKAKTARIFLNKHSIIAHCNVFIDN